MPRLRIAERIGQRITFLHAVRHVPGQIPHALLSGLLGDDQFNLRGVTAMRFITGIHHHFNQVTCLQGINCIGAECLLFTIVEHSLGEGIRSQARNYFHAPGCAVAAYPIGISNQAFEANLSIHRALPIDDGFLGGRRVHGHAASREGQRAKLDNLTRFIGKQVGCSRLAPAANIRVTAHVGHSLGIVALHHELG